MNEDLEYFNKLVKDFSLKDDEYLNNIITNIILSEEVEIQVRKI